MDLCGDTMGFFTENEVDLNICLQRVAKRQRGGIKRQRGIQSRRAKEKRANGIFNSK
jgi:hypothetical protein